MNATAVQNGSDRAVPAVYAGDDENNNRRYSRTADRTARYYTRHERATPRNGNQTGGFGR